MSVNRKIADILEKRGIKQSFLVNTCEMSKDAVSNFLAGKRKLTAEEFLKICVALDIDPNTFR